MAFSAKVAQLSFAGRHTVVGANRRHRYGRTGLAGHPGNAGGSGLDRGEVVCSRVSVTCVMPVRQRFSAP